MFALATAAGFVRDLHKLPLPAINSRSRTDQLVGRDSNSDRSPPVRCGSLAQIMGARDFPQDLRPATVRPACRAHIRRGDAIISNGCGASVTISIRWGETGREFVAPLVAFIQFHPIQAQPKYPTARPKQRRKVQAGGQAGVFLRCWLLSSPRHLAGERKVACSARIVSWIIYC